MNGGTSGFPVLHYAWSLLKFMSIMPVMPSNHLILCCPLLLLPSIFPSIRVFSNELALPIGWPKYWSFIIPNLQGENGDSGGQGELPKGTVSGGQAQGTSHPKLTCSFPHSHHLCSVFSLCPPWQGLGPPRAPSVLCLHWIQGGRVPQGSLEAPKSPLKSQVASGTRCRHPAGEGKKVKGALGPQSRQGHKPRGQGG